MRFRPLALLFVVLFALALPAGALADIKPIPKPPTSTTPVQPANPPQSTPSSQSTQSSQSTPPPVSKPSTSSTSSSSGSASTGTTTKTKTSTGTPARTLTPPPPFVPSVSFGGRDQSGVVVPPPAPPVPSPTPLAFVGSADRIPSHTPATPPWKLALLALLAATEAFLVVRLVRNRPVTFSTAQ